MYLQRWTLGGTTRRSLPLPAGDDVDEALDWLTLLDLKLAFLLGDQIQVTHQLPFQFAHVTQFPLNVLAKLVLQGLAA